MNKELEIRQLLSKYYDGDTTPEEETLLRQFFSMEDIPSDLLPEKGLFTAMGEFKSEEHLHEDFHLKFRNALNNNELNKKIVAKPFFRRYFLAAASFIGVLITSVFMYNYFVSQSSGLVINNSNFSEHKQETVNETKKAFMLIADKLQYADASMQKLGYIDKAFNNVRKNKIFKISDNK